MPGDHWPLDAGLGKVKRGCNRVETCQSPCDRAGWERLLCPCVTVLLKDYLYMCHRGNCVGAGQGQGGSGFSFYIKGATSL